MSMNNHKLRLFIIVLSALPALCASMTRLVALDTIDNMDFVVSGTLWDSDGADPIRIGRAAGSSGTLSIINGGTVASLQTWIGQNEGATGIVMISGKDTGGAPSTWDISKEFDVGVNGSGTVIMSDGALLHTGASAAAYIGNSLTGTGVVIMSGSNTTWRAEAIISVGRSGKGTFLIENGASAQSANGYVAQSNVNSAGEVTITGEGSGWSVSNSFVLGYTGTGVLTVSNGGVLSVRSGAGTVSIGSGGNGRGTLNIGAAEGAVASSPGILNAAIVSGVGAQNILVFNHTATGASPYYFTTNGMVSGSSIQITGNVDIIHAAGNTVLGQAHTAKSFALNGGAFSLDNTMTLTGGFSLKATGTAGFHAGTAKITAGDVTIASGASINITGFAEGSAEVVSLIESNSVITTSVNDINLLFNGAAQATESYRILQLQSGNAGRSIQVTSILSWNANSNAHGTYEIAAGSSDAINAVLADREPGSFAAPGGWDGKTLVKTGGGMLVLGAQNTYTGQTIVVTGTLRTSVSNAIAHSSGLVLTSSGGLSGFDMRGSGTQTLNTLSGAGIILMNTNLEQGTGDLLVITGSSGGVHSLRIYNTGEDRMDYSQIIVSDPGGAAYSLAAPVNAGIYSYGLKKDGTDWVLYNSQKISPLGEAILHTVASLGAEWHYDLDSAQKRMGEVRLEKPWFEKNPGGSFWMRGAAYHLNAKPDAAGTGFESNSHALNAGADKVLVKNRSMWILGVMMNAGSIERTFDRRLDNPAGSSNGDSDVLGGGAYIAWFNDSGFHMDVTANYNNYDNNITVYSSDSNVISASYGNKVKSVSAELGWDIRPRRGWRLTPALQYAKAWIDGAEYATSTNLEVKIDDATAQQYRASLAFGYSGKSRWLPHLRVAGAWNDTTEGTVRAERNEFSPWFGGFRLEIGGGIGCRISASSRVYLDYEYARATRYDRPWSFMLGYRFAW